MLYPDIMNIALSEIFAYHCLCLIKRNCVKRNDTNIYASAHVIVRSNFIIPVCEIELINEIESIKRERIAQCIKK